MSRTGGRRFPKGTYRLLVLDMSLPVYQIPKGDLQVDEGSETNGKDSYHRQGRGG